MSRLLLVLAAVAVVGAAAAVSRTAPTDTTAGPDLTIEVADKNPWSHLRVNRDPDQFQFAIVSDRTGGHRAKVFSQAVHQLNLLQPEFVVSVGDLIEGYTQRPEVSAQQWDEFDGWVKKLEMPFFYVPGNHDLTNQQQAEQWGGRYGKSYYHFVYKNTLFLAVNSEDAKAGHITPGQIATIRQTLAAYPAVRWTMVFLHKPLWTVKDQEANGWAAVEQALAGRKYTVFCGHVHRYQKFVRNGMNYYQLATTGGGSKLRGPDYGEFDHTVLVTMKKSGPVLANVLLDGVLPEDLTLPDSDETGSPGDELLKTVVMNPTTVTLTMNGRPVPGAVVGLHGAPIPGVREREVANGRTDINGVAVMTTRRANDGVPVGEYKVVVYKLSGGRFAEGEEASELPVRYARKDTSGLTATVVSGKNELRIELK